MSTYGWRGSILLMSGVLLHCLPCCMLLRSPMIPTPPDDNLFPDPEESKVPEELFENGVRDTQKLVLLRSVNGTGSLHTGLVASKTSMNASKTMMHSDSISTMSITSAQQLDRKLAAGSALSVAMMFSSTVSLPHQGSVWGSSHLAATSSTSHLPANKRTFLQLIKDMLTPETSASDRLNPVILLAIACWFFYFAGMPVVYVFCAVKAMSIGLGAAEGALLLSVEGLGEISGRLLGSLIGSCHDHLPLIIFVLNVVLSGLSCALVGICTTYSQMIAAVVTFGITMGMCTCMSSTVVRDLVGIAQVPCVFGFAFAMGGVGNMFSIQILALIWERTNAVIIPFITGGSFLVVAGLTMVAAHVAHLREKL